MTESAVTDDKGGTVAKAKVATIWLDGCSGCHMSFLDIDERLLLLAERADLVYGCLVDAKEFPEGVDVTLVEGAVSSTEDLRKIREVRARSRVVVSLGDCAVTSNVPGMRNPFGPQAVLEQGVPGERHAEPTNTHHRLAGPIGRVTAGACLRAGGRLRARVPALGRPNIRGCPGPA